MNITAVLQETCDSNAHELIGRLVPPVVERIVGQRLRESVREQGGLIHKDMQAMRSGIAHLRQGLSCSTWANAMACYQLCSIDTVQRSKIDVLCKDLKNTENCAKT